MDNRPTTFEARVTEITVTSAGKPLFDESATTLRITDEVAGEFVVIEQNAPAHGWTGKVAVQPEEWPAIREAIDRLIESCREYHEDA